MKWDNEKTGLTTILEANVDGDMRLLQAQIGSEKDFDAGRRIVAPYEYRPNFLAHLFLFCLQTDTPLPFLDDWEKRFYGGKFEFSEVDLDVRCLLRNMMKDTSGKPNLTLPMEGLSSLDEKKLKELREDLAIRQIFNREIAVFPYITKDRHLAYLTFPPNPMGIKLGKEDLACAFDEITNQCFEHRGQGKVPGLFYKAFPFNKPYDEVFGQ